jgi:hypothetical protein
MAPPPRVGSAITQETVLTVPEPPDGWRVIYLPLLPAVVDLDAVPLGSWAEYEVTYSGELVMKERLALVAKGPQGNTLESTLKEVKQLGQMVRATVFATPGTPADADITRRVVQSYRFDPIEWPDQIAEQRPYARPDPTKLLGEETITVRGGTYTTKHYVDTTRFAEPVDYWIDERVAPLGLVKLEAEERQAAGAVSTAGRRVTYELLVSGTGAKPQITKTPQPYEHGTMIKPLARPSP